ncbi:MAG: DUF6292 family protein [Sciscionella sp.]
MTETRTPRPARDRAARTEVRLSSNTEESPDVRIRYRQPTMEGTDLPSEGLRHYVRLVACAVGVGAESTICAPGDLPATAYIALDRRYWRYPAHDAALVWHERRGWALAIEKAGASDLDAVHYFPGELVPEPRQVARSVDEVLGGSESSEPLPVEPRRDASALSDTLAYYARLARGQAGESSG